MTSRDNEQQAAAVKDAYRRGLDDARKMNCERCQRLGPPLWHPAARAYFHVEPGAKYKGCDSEAIQAHLDGQDLQRD